MDKIEYLIIELKDADPEEIVDRIKQFSSDTPNTAYLLRADNGRIYIGTWNKNNTEK